LDWFSSIQRRKKKKNTVLNKQKRMLSNILFTIIQIIFCDWIEAHPQVEHRHQFCVCWCIILTGKQVIPICKGRYRNGCHGIHFRCCRIVFCSIWRRYSRIFGLAIDAGNKAWTAYLDLQMQCYFKGALQDFHLLAIPMRNVTLENISMFSLLKWWMSFEHCWIPLGSEFEDMQRFCGAIASIMPGTSSVESDFSLINWTKDSSSKSLTDFSVESILHCK